MKDRDDLAAQLRQFDELDPVAACARLNDLVDRTPPSRAFAEAIADRLIASANPSDTPSALESGLLAHLSTLAPSSDAQLLRVILQSDSRAVVLAALEIERQLSDDDRLAWRLSVVCEGADSEETFGTVLEEAMVQRYRWSLDDWRAFVRRTPTALRASSRVVWTAHGARSFHFRLSPEGEVLDDADEPVALAGVEEVSLGHTLDFTEHAIERWGRIFADYDIVALVQQFDRLIATPPASWEKRDAVPIHRGSPLTPTVLHFVRRGWAVRQKGSRRFFDRKFGEKIVATVSWHGSADEAHLIELYFARESGQPLFLGDLPPIAYSEALLTLSELDSIGR